MKTREEIEKMLQNYTMKAEMYKRNAKDKLWRITLARIRTCELILEYDYQAMLKIKRKRNHEKRSRMMKKRWENA